YAELRLADRLLSAERRLVTEQIASMAQGNFDYARLVLDSLLDGAKGSLAILATTDQVLRPDRIPNGLQEAYVAMIYREVDCNVERRAQRYRPFVSLLAVAPEGLTLSQLAGITQRQRSEVADSLRVVGRFLSGPDSKGRYRLFHTSFAIF